jgi:hypothetical protein
MVAESRSQTCSEIPNEQVISSFNASLLCYECTRFDYRLWNLIFHISLRSSKWNKRRSHCPKPFPLHQQHKRLMLSVYSVPRDMVLFLYIRRNCLIQVSTSKQVSITTRPDFIVFPESNEYRYCLIIDKYQSHNTPRMWNAAVRMRPLTTERKTICLFLKHLQNQGVSL